MHANGVNVIRLRNRVLDPELRAEIERFESESAIATLPPQEYKGLDAGALEAAANRLSARFGTQYAIVMDRLGTAVRAELKWLPGVGELHER